nr:small secreted protein [Streptomyces sp. AJS327]
MNKKLAAALSGSAALVLALTGCSEESDKEKDAWAKKVCDKVKPQVTKIQEANVSIDEVSRKKPKSDSEKAARAVSEQVKKTDSAAFHKISRAYGSLATAVDDAGAPPVDDGATLKKDAVAELKTLSRKYAGLKRTVDKLDTEDQGEFGRGLKGVANELKQLGESGDQALSKLQSGDLGEAMAKQKGCKKPGKATNAPDGS